MCECMWIPSFHPRKPRTNPTSPALPPDAPYTPHPACWNARAKDGRNSSSPHTLDTSAWTSTESAVVLRALRETPAKPAAPCAAPHPDASAPMSSRVYWPGRTWGRADMPGPTVHRLLIHSPLLGPPVGESPDSTRSGADELGGLGG